MGPNISRIRFYGRNARRKIDWRLVRVCATRNNGSAFRASVTSLMGAKVIEALRTEALLDFEPPPNSMVEAQRHRDETRKDRDRRPTWKSDCPKVALGKFIGLRRLALPGQLEAPTLADRISIFGVFLVDGLNRCDAVPKQIDTVRVPHVRSLFLSFGALVNDLRE